MSQQTKDRLVPDEYALLLRRKYDRDPNGVTTHNCATVVREGLLLLGFEKAARAMPIGDAEAENLIANHSSAMPWDFIGGDVALADRAGDIILCGNAQSSLGVSIVVDPDDGRVLTATPAAGVHRPKKVNLKDVHGIYRPTA